VNQPIRRVALFCFLLIVSLLVSSNYLQVVNADSYKARGANQRNILDAYAFPRGEILTADGVVIAKSVPSGGVNYKYQRVYPLGAAYGNITGYKSLSFGATDIEYWNDKYLQGLESSETVSNFLDVLNGNTKKGGNVVLTLDNKVQQAAITAMGSKIGSVVALDPTTGAILAMYSNPSYDPSGVSNNNGKVATAAGNALGADKNKPNLNRAINELYPPGSIFKVVTAAAALESGKFNENDQTAADPRQMSFPNSPFKIHNENDGVCPGTDLKVALQNSCNTVFGYVGTQVGTPALAQTAANFGLNSPGLTVPMSVTPSVFPTNTIGADQTFLAQASIGQFNDQLTPLQAAMIAGAVANGGTVMKPFMVQKEINSRGDVTSTTKPEVLSQAFSNPATAQALDDMMVNVVNNGTGTNAQIPGVKVGGKTGTAQRGEGQNPLAWFISYATANGKTVAVAVLVQDDNAKQRDDISGGGYAAPVAKKVMEAALGVAEQ
jgi:cell division protein FtsI/penicillin-binding protein 2